ncbi:AMP-binding protein [Marinilabilia sp.]|uniref:AMP-binding protein n=1 Tax=Marinilabilia sp. TaxID=2021252 RepID=UPI0025C1113C|nr:AMP-binding protein [Marinilabilia sp.]
MQKDFKNYSSLTISGTPYTDGELLALCNKKLQVNGLPAWEKSFYRFLSEWLNDVPFVVVKTSGSTGSPKTIKVAKSALLQSAFNTLFFFNLIEGQTALLCLPCDYIAGKMMVVRAFAGNLNLIPVSVSGTPLSSLQHPVDFAALTPFQMSNELRKNQKKMQLLKTVILGGSVVGEGLTKQLLHQPFEAWETYGMTETLSHVALRPINGTKKEKYFTPLPNVTILSDNRGCLTIDAPGITEGTIVTNDLAEMTNNGKFRILGRIDNIINSGGIKISPEELEAQIVELISCPFFISSLPHPQLGQELVLVTEKPPQDENHLLNEIRKMVPPHHVPRKIIIRNPLPRTENGKIKRILNI